MAQNKALLEIDPHELVIIGRDTSDNEEHPLYDPRGLEDPDEELAADIGARGQLQPIRVRKHGAAYEVIAGRRRVLAMRLWNMANPTSKLVVKATISRGESEAELLEAVIVENEHRREDTPLGKARKAWRLIDRYGYTHVRVAKLFRCSTQTLAGWMELLDAAQEVQELVEKGEISQADAHRVSILPHADQTAAVALAKTEGQSVSEVVSQVAMARAPGRWARVSKRKMRTRDEIEDAIADKTLDDDELGWRQALRWVLGEVEFSAAEGPSQAVQ